MHLMSGGAAGRRSTGVLMLASLRSSETVDEESPCVCKPSMGDRKMGDRDPTRWQWFFYIQKTALAVASI